MPATKNAKLPRGVFERPPGSGTKNANNHAI